MCLVNVGHGVDDDHDGDVDVNADDDDHRDDDDGDNHHDDDFGDDDHDGYRILARRCLDFKFAISGFSVDDLRILSWSIRVSHVILDLKFDGFLDLFTGLWIDLEVFGASDDCRVY